MFSPTDLVGFLACTHLTELDRAAFAGLVAKNRGVDAELDLLVRKGLEHERRYLERLRAAGRGVTEIAEDEGDPARLLAARDATLAAMRRGDDVIYQATFVEEGWSGKADFLVRVERPDAPTLLGPWGYEPEDTKLALSAKASALLQLLTYARMVQAVQGTPPENIHVVLGRAEPTRATFRVADYAAYHRLVRRRFVEGVRGGPPPSPALLEIVADPNEHCGVCAWAAHCGGLRYRTGHLSRVAFIRRAEVEKLRAAGVSTIWALGDLLVPAPRIDGLAGEVVARLQDQAAMQLEEERTHRRFHRILEHPAPPPERGLLILPEPSRLDVFFDFEGDRFALDGGLEYLFGWVETPAAGSRPEDAPYHVLWAHDRAQERQALEVFVDVVTERRTRDPGMHVYHYASYEPAALHRLTQRHDTRQEELDVLLRAGVFVDLYRAVRQGVRVSSESYSIKRLEPLYALTRDADGIAKSLSSMIAYERWIETSEGAILDDIAAYNRDDCVSNLMLRDWLELRRAELVDRRGADPGRPIAESGDPSAATKAADADVAAVRAALSADIPPATLEAEVLAPEPQARRLLGNLLGWHRREARAEWFEWFRLRDLDSDDLVRDATPIGGLQFAGEVGREARSRVLRWRFDPAQETKLGAGDEALAAPGGQQFGDIIAIDLDAGTVDVKVGPKHDTPALESIVGLLPARPIETTNQRRALLEVGRWVAAHGIDAAGPYRAVRDVLLRRLPRIAGTAAGPSLVHAGEEPVDAARRLALALDRSCLAIQGPPGSGKTYAGARIVVDLVRAGRAGSAPRRVGVTAFSHAAIGNLLEAVVAYAAEAGVPLRILQKASQDQWCGLAAVERAGDNEQVEAQLAQGTVDVVAGTAWLWSRPGLAGTLDTLVVDEAGQVSLANLVAMGRAAASLVLLGDPQQLSQPVKGVHPAGAGKSALEHVLGEHQAIPPERGVFLATTRRLHPSIAAFTSELFYEGKLRSLEGLENQAILGPDGLLAGSGLRWIPVEHVGRSNASPEEVAVVADTVRDLLGRAWRDREGNLEPLRPRDLLVVAPYNAQVGRLRQALPPGVEVGTVDRFQGQEAPVVLYSMATSTPDDMPRDLSFLFSLNRLNVATSRARALIVLVCSPALLTVACRTPEQMRLANAMARFVELVRVPLTGAETSLPD